MSRDRDKSVRAGPRTKEVVDLSKHLFTGTPRQPVRCLALDVSANGLGVVSFEALSVGGDAVLVLSQWEVVLKVVWSRPDEARQGVFRSGLETTDLSVNLVTLLTREGLLPKAAETPAKAQAQITFDSVRAALATAHTPDSGAFRSGPTAKLARSHNGYPINIRGVSLYVLLPKDLRPPEASRLSEDEAAARWVLIVRSDRGLMRKIWPVEPAKS